MAHFVRSSVHPLVPLPILWILVVQVPCTYSQNLPHTRYIDWSTGRDSVVCLNRGLNGSNSERNLCKTLSYACTDVLNGSRLVLMPGLQVLTDNVILKHVSNITITSLSDEAPLSILNCSQGNIGLKFEETETITITTIEIHYCGLVQKSTSTSAQNDSTTVDFLSALYFLNSTNVQIRNVSVVHSNGTGITMFDTGGNIVIENVYFYANRIPYSDQVVSRGGGGLYIELTSCSPGYVLNDCGPNPFVFNNNYVISNCTFLENIQSNLPNSTTTFLTHKGPAWQRFGFGGGISIALKGLSRSNSFVIEKCNFTRNNANIGGGMSLMVDDQSKGNLFLLTNNTFSQNGAKYGGGGIEFGFFNVNGTKDTCIKFQNCNFISNTALYGGGTAFYSSRVAYSSKANNSVVFRSCKWSNNQGLVGSAMVLFPESWVSLSSGYLPTIVFQDTRFNGNEISHYPPKPMNNTSSDNVIGAIIYSNMFSLNFTGDNYFQRNNGSSIRIAIADINVLENSNIEFSNNIAEKGGAVSLAGYASIIAHKGSRIVFANNTANLVGGAVYYESSDYLDALNSRRCFLRYSEVIPVNEWHTEFIFINNTAKKYGKSIYATYLEACARSSVTNASVSYDIHNVFNWPSFTFIPALDSQPHTITSDPVYIRIDGTQTISAVPGIETNVKLIAEDGLHQTLQTVLYASCENDCEYGNISSTYQFISNNKIVINGIQNKSITIHAETLTGRLLDVKIKIDIDFCPPGFYFEDGICHCSVSTVHELPGITACDDISSKAKMQIGYWAGCIPSKDESGLILETGQCPLGYCNYPNQSNGLILLSSNCSSLTHILCKPKNRQGILCGECIEGYSVYYHSERFECNTCRYAAYGILFYILTELLPLTLLFILVIVFDFSLTSGEVTSFILFAQVLDFFDTTAFGVYYIPSWMAYPVQIYKFVFGFLNLEFFKLDLLSFCLWRGTNVLDVLAFKYVTCSFGFALIAVLFLIMRYTNCNILKKYRRNNYGGYTVTNGLVAFIIITYSQCAKVSFEILARYELNVDSSVSLSDPLEVVFLAGNIPFFSPQHMKYALPAIFFVLYTAIVPVILISQPLYGIISKRYGRMHQRNSPIRSMGVSNAPLCFKKFQLRLKPILDAFQYSFKDDTRVFAGLLFVYRFAIAAAFAFAVTAASMYSLLEVIVLVMIAIHSIFQPYSSKAHNVTETLIYTNLAIINGISLYNTAVSQSHDSHNQTKILAAIQLVLIYVPITYFSIKIVVRLLIYIKIKRNCVNVTKDEDNVEVDFTSDTTPYRLLHDDQPTHRERQPLIAYGSVQQDRTTY